MVQGMHKPHVGEPVVQGVCRSPLGRSLAHRLHKSPVRGEMVRVAYKPHMGK